MLLHQLFEAEVIDLDAFKKKKQSQIVPMSAKHAENTLLSKLSVLSKEVKLRTNKFRNITLTSMYREINMNPLIQWGFTVDDIQEHHEKPISDKEEQRKFDFLFNELTNNIDDLISETSWVATQLWKLTKEPWYNDLSPKQKEKLQRKVDTYKVVKQHFIAFKKAYI